MEHLYLFNWTSNRTFGAAIRVPKQKQAHRLCERIKPYYYYYCKNKVLLKPYKNKVLLKSYYAKYNISNTIELEAMNSIDESDVGIFCYISQLPGFQGVLKQRYSDFIVNEVDLDGNVVHLISMEAPPEVVEDEETKISDPLNKNYDTELELFRSLSGESDARHLKDFIVSINSGGVKDEVSPIVLSPSSDKSHRTVMHNFFKENFKFLVTDTIDGPDSSSKSIRVWLNSGKNSGRDRNSKKRKDRGYKPYDNRGSDSWPEHLGKFLRFHLYKENKDTQEALGLIGKMLGVQPRSFGFAGTKDKRAVTTQMVTVFKQRASKLAALNERLIGIKVGDFCHVKDGLLLGQLHGNRFTITLRSVDAESEDTVKASSDALGRLGFINYFGLQRFGSGSVPTHLIGASLLRGEWKTAVSLILDPREGEKDVIRKVREYYRDSDDIEGTLRQLPRHLVAERSILQCLKKCPGNYLQALKAIPRTLRMMYVHSYQSYLWNHAASMRVQKYGIDQVVLGDLVYCIGESAENVTGVSVPECEDDEGNDTHDSQLHEISETVLPEERSNPVKARAVNEADLVSGNYTIDDIVLPLPGSRVIYPSNDIGNVYHDLAKKDAINLTGGVHNVKEFSITNMGGDYRRVFQKPKNFEWELLTYTDGNVPLVKTDLDVITESRPAVAMVREENSANGKKDYPFLKQSKSSEDSTVLSTDNHDEPELGREAALSKLESSDCSTAQEAQMALKLSFTLPASCYATMAIRELLKRSTSVAFHKTLNR